MSRKKRGFPSADIAIFSEVSCVSREKRWFPSVDIAISSEIDPACPVKSAGPLYCAVKRYIVQYHNGNVEKSQYFVALK